MSTVAKLNSRRALLSEIARLQNKVEELQQENSRLQQKSDHDEKVKYLDPLTEVQNRSQLPGILEREIERAKPSRRRKSPITNFCIAFLDVDFFKAINDSYGHLIGDEVLVLLARILKENRRKTDWIIRYGGEEFLIVLTNCDVKKARVYLERLRKSLCAQFIIKTENDEIRPTVSIGLAQWMPDMTQKALIGNADSAMYQAKRAGRNRICVA